MSEADRIRELTRHLLDRTKETDILREALERIAAIKPDLHWKGGMSGESWTLCAPVVQEIARDALLRAKGETK